MSNFEENASLCTNEQVFVNSLGKLKSNRKRYDCHLCPKYFTRPSALLTHSYTHTGEKPHGCDIAGCGRRFAVISNLRRHLRVHKPAHTRRRLTSQERREHVEKLIQRSVIDGSHHFDDSNMDDAPTIYYSSSSSSTSSSPRGSMSPRIESTTYRLLKPKQARPLCLTVQHLLN